MIHFDAGSSVRRGNVVMKCCPVRDLTRYVGVSKVFWLFRSFCCTPVTYSTGSGVKSFLGSESTSLFSLPLHVHPSRYSPYTYTPSEGASRSCSNSLGGCVTSDVITTSSSAHLSLLCLRFTSCFIAVRNPCGLKKPVSQYPLGRPVLSHLCSWSKRCNSPWNHEPMVALSHENLSHVEGMLALKSLFSASTRSPASAMVPAMASRRFLSVSVVRFIMMLRRSISCRK
mmetsp:Transcript_14309/g.34773  ORF Transcript_14309/g.34773 Transcript_14309/m.34773 type:complete len:228 (-) Transcript_14309:7018-7701(-)